MGGWCGRVGWVRKGWGGVGGGVLLPAPARKEGALEEREACGRGVFGEKEGLSDSRRVCGVRSGGEGAGERSGLCSGGNFAGMSVGKNEIEKQEEEARRCTVRWVGRRGRGMRRRVDQPHQTKCRSKTIPIWEGGHAGLFSRVWYSGSTCTVSGWRSFEVEALRL